MRKVNLNKSKIDYSNMDLPTYIYTYIEKEAKYLKKYYRRTLPLAIFTELMCLVFFYKMIELVEVAYNSNELFEVGTILAFGVNFLFFGVLFVFMSNHIYSLFINTKWSSILKYAKKGNYTYREIKYNRVFVANGNQDGVKVYDLDGNAITSKTIRLYEDCGGQGLLISIFDDSNKNFYEFVIPKQ